MLPERVHPPITAVIATELSIAVACVITWKAARTAPAGTATSGGTLASPGLLLDSLTVTPPAAGRKISTVPKICVPPTTLGELNVIAGMHGCTIIVFERRDPSADIEIRTSTSSSSTGCVIIGNLVPRSLA
jgi:hypothetical protein